MSDTSIPTTPVSTLATGTDEPAVTTAATPRRFTYAQALRALRSRAFTFTGRAGRSEFWWAVVGLTTLTLPLVPLVVWLSLASPIAGVVLALLASVGLVVLTVAELALTARRLHDRGLSGWLQLLQLAPLGGLALLVLCALPGEAGDNRHGPVSAPTGGRRSPALVVGSFAAWLAAAALTAAVVGPLSDLARESVATDAAAAAVVAPEAPTDQPVTVLDSAAAAEQVGGCWSAPDAEGQLAPVTCDDPSVGYTVTEVVADSALCADWYLDADRAGYYLCLSEPDGTR